MARGCIRERTTKSETVYDVIVSYKDATGKRKQIWKTRPSFRQAEKLKNQLLSEVDLGTFVKPSKLTVRAYLEQWMNSYVVPSLSASAVDTYQLIIRKHILPVLGDIPLANLQSLAIQNLYAVKIKEGKSTATIRKIHNILHKSLHKAMTTGLIVRDPFIGVECPTLKSREMITLNETDIHLILDRARDTDYYPLWYTLIFTGLRRSEALGLKWGDVDLLLLKISVNRSLVYLNHAVNGNRILEKTPKTARSRRYISITPSNAIVLRGHYQKQNENRKRVGVRMLQDSDFIFSTLDGKPYLPNSITHAWIKLVRRCGLPGRRLHDCRHTYATLLLKQNVNSIIVSRQLGHASVKTTEDIYSHVIPQMQEQAATQFDDIVIGNISVRNSLDKASAPNENNS